MFLKNLYKYKIRVPIQIYFLLIFELFRLIFQLIQNSYLLILN